MRIGRMGGRRVPARWAYRGSDWNASLRSWVRQWLAVLTQAPAAQWSWEQRRSLAEVALYVGAYLVYVFSRGLVYDNPRAVGTVNGGLIADFQQRVRASCGSPAGRPGRWNTCRGLWCSSTGPTSSPTGR